MQLLILQLYILLYMIYNQVIYFAMAHVLQ